MLYRCGFQVVVIIDPTVAWTIVPRRSHHSPRLQICILLYVCGRVYSKTTCCNYVVVSLILCTLSRAQVLWLQEYCNRRDNPLAALFSSFSIIVRHGRSRGIVCADPLPKPGVSYTLKKREMLQMPSRTGGPPLIWRRRQLRLALRLPVAVLVFS